MATRNVTRIMSDPFWPERNIYRQPSGLQDENRVTYFAETDARNKRVPFGIKAKDRTRHMYVIGKTGMGKSTLLENLAVQDIRNGEGLCFIDPHGKTADLLLDYVPQERLQDVLYFAPFDTEYPISFNVMEDVGEDKRHLVVSGLMSAFKKIWGEDTFSARMEYILQNTIHALIEYPHATLLGVNRMYTDKAFRKKVVDNISDMSVKTFWEEEFAGYTDRFAAEATPAIQNKVGQFTSNPLIRNVIGQPRSSFDLRRLMDESKILIVNLSKGRVGETNANLLGSMLITKLYLAAMSRADAADGEGFPDFHLYVDEFQSFANESFADILSEARKYSLTLTVAHQYMAQMSEEVRDAVMGNVGTMVTFRIGGYDAEILEKELQPTFAIEDMVNLGFAQIYIKLMINEVTSPPFSATTLPPIQKPEISFRGDIIANSRKQFARARAEVEQEIGEWQGLTATMSEGGKGDKSSGNRHAPPKQRASASKNTEKKKPSRKKSNDSVKKPSRKPEEKHREKSAPDTDTDNDTKNPFAGIQVGKDGTLRVNKKTETSEGVSLSRLEHQKKPKRGREPDTKGPSPEHLSELKKTLSSLVGENKSNTKQHAVSDTKKKQPDQSQASHSQKQHTANTKNKEQKTQKQKKEQKKQKTDGEPAEDDRTPKTREIPQSELEHMLRVDDE